MNNIAKMNIFNMFHDGVFVSLDRNNQSIDFQIEIRYVAELIQPEYTFFRGTLVNCWKCQFKRWEDKDIAYEDIKVINSLIRGMEILHARLDGEQIIVNCQGMEKENKGGDFLFGCDDIELFDQGGYPVTEEDLQVLVQKAFNYIIEEQNRKVADRKRIF